MLTSAGLCGACACRPTSRRVLIGGGLAAAALISLPMTAWAEDERIGEVRHSEEEWKEILGADAYRILRRVGGP
jgi:hypothetical protein